MTDFSETHEVRSLRIFGWPQRQGAGRRRSAARTAGSCGCTPLASASGRATAAPEIRLQQMRECVDVAQLAVFHAEEMSVGRTAATGCVSGAEGVERHNRTDCRVHHEA